MIMIIITLITTTAAAASTMCYDDGIDQQQPVIKGHDCL